MGRKAVKFPNTAEPLVVQLRDLIQALGTTEERVTKEAKLSKYTIYRMGHCKNGPRIDCLRKAFDVLGYEICVRPKGGA